MVQNVDAVIFDVDGILTDGAVYVDSFGHETKRILFDDIDAIFALRRAGMKIGFITAENTGFCEYVRRRFEPDFFLSGCKDKLAAFKELSQKTGLEKDRVVYAGDSRKDIELLKYVGRSFAPSDVDSQIQSAATVVLRSRRGQGVIREIAQDLLGS